MRLPMLDGISPVTPFSSSTSDWRFSRTPKSEGMFPMRPGFDLNSSDSKLLASFSQFPDGMIAGNLFCD